MVASTARRVRARAAARRARPCTLLSAALACSTLFAQTAPESTPRPDLPPSAAARADSACRCLPAGTVVQLEITEAIHSARRSTGEPFALRVHAPLGLDGHDVIPAGTPGMGEVIHADRSRGGGKPGELLLAARHLRLGERRIPLRGLKLGGAGRDKAGAALAASFVIGPFALFVRGNEIEIPEGTVVEARLAESVPSPVSVPPASIATPTPEE